MNSTPSASRPPPFLPKDQQQFALFLGVVSAVLVLLIAGHRPAAVALGSSPAEIRRAAKEWHRGRALRGLDGACRREDCGCALALARVGLDVDAGAAVVAVLDSAKGCRGEAGFAGLHAEALVRAGFEPKGMTEAGNTLQAAPRDGYALMTLALGRFRVGDNAHALELATRAGAVGRGDGARMLEGVVHYNAGRQPEARRAFEAVLANEPEDVAALYNLGLVARAQDRYGEARRLLLQVLREKPAHKEARYHLAALAHSVGADEEAQHHLQKLAANAPGDPLIESLKKELATAPAHPPAQVLSLGAPASSVGAAPAR